MTTTLTGLSLIPLAAVQGQIARADTISSISANLNVGDRSALGFGTDDGEADQVYAAAATVAVETTTTYTLDDGSLSNPFGGEITFGTLKVVLIENTGAVPLVLGGTCDLWRADASDEITIPAGGSLSMIARETGWTVGAGETVTVENEDAETAGAYNIVLIGTEAE